MRAPVSSSAPPTSAASPGWMAIDFARSRLGTPYCYGGTGPSCYDCSGLTQAAWRAAGKSIPRTSEQQAEALTEVDLDRLELGDVLWRPGHVALYAGEGWVVNAPKTGDVVRFQRMRGYQKALRP